MQLCYGSDKMATYLTVSTDMKTEVRHLPWYLLIVIMVFTRFVVSLVYFGFDLYTTQLPGSIYLNYFIMNLIDIPIVGVVWFTFLR